VRRALVVGAALMLAGCATMEDRAPLSGEATLKDKDGKQVGVATLIQQPDGVRIVVTGYRLPPASLRVSSRTPGRPCARERPAANARPPRQSDGCS